MKHPPERPCVLVQDTREPHEEAGDHPDSVFRPFILATCPRDTPYADRPRTVLPVERRKLDVGDYSLPGLEGVVALERKSGLDLLATLFGDAGMDSVGAQRNNIDRFRAELERALAGRYQLFAIIVEGDQDWIFAEAAKRFRRYGKSFDPASVFAILRSFATDLATNTIWCRPIWEWIVDEDGEVRRRGRRIFTAKQAAELEVGATLARVWSQATGGSKARAARKRGYPIPWLDVLAGGGVGDGDSRVVTQDRKAG